MHNQLKAYTYSCTRQRSETKFFRWRQASHHGTRSLTLTSTSVPGFSAERFLSAFAAGRRRSRLDHKMVRDKEHALGDILLEVLVPGMEVLVEGKVVVLDRREVLVGRREVLLGKSRIPACVEKRQPQE